MRLQIVGVLTVLSFATTSGFAQSNAISLQSIQPNAVVAGSGSTTIILKGAGFTSSTMLLLSQVVSSSAPGQLTPVFLDETTLQVTLPSSLLNTPVTISIRAAIPNVAYSEALFFYVYSPAPPIVMSMIPAGGLPGKTTAVALTGMNLAGATMTFSGSGVTAVPDDQTHLFLPTQFNLQVKVDSNAPLGAQDVTITTPSGSTTTCSIGPCTFSVVEPGSWSHEPADSLSFPAALLLLDGRFLIAGGWTLQSPFLPSPAVRIFDPLTNSLTEAARMNTPRSQGTAILMSDGRVLLMGGYGNEAGRSWEPISSSEVYDPATDTWSTIGLTASTGQLLPNGKVLAARSVSSSTESGYEMSIFDPESGRSEPIRDLPVPIWAWSLLSDGRVLLVGGPPLGLRTESTIPLAAHSQMYRP